MGGLRCRGPARPGSVLVVAVGLAVGAIALAGCSGEEQSGTPAQQVSTWVDQGGGGSSIGNLEVDAKNVDLALNQHNEAAAIREVCALLSNDAQTGVGNLPTPDETLTTDLDNAYVDATGAGDDCYNGAAGNRRLLAKSADERTRLFALLRTAVRRIETVTGETPSTNTTTPPSGNSDPFAGGT